MLSLATEAHSGPLVPMRDGFQDPHIYKILRCSSLTGNGLAFAYDSYQPCCTSPLDRQKHGAQCDVSSWFATQCLGNNVEDKGLWVDVQYRCRFFPNSFFPLQQDACEDAEPLDGQAECSVYFFGPSKHSEQKARTF